MCSASLINPSQQALKVHVSFFFANLAISLLFYLLIYFIHQLLCARVCVCKHHELEVRSSNANCGVPSQQKLPTAEGVLFFCNVCSTRIEELQEEKKKKGGKGENKNKQL